MLVNIEHVAQRNFSPARTTSADGYREAVADSGEAPIAVGVTNNSPFLQELIDAGPARFGVNFISERSTFQSGETGGWAAIQRRQGQRDAGAAALPHDRRGARRDLGARDLNASPAFWHSWYPRPIRRRAKGSIRETHFRPGNTRPRRRADRRRCGATAARRRSRRSTT